MNIPAFAVYKGLQRPLIYKGFKGKFIGYGVGALVAGLVTGGIIGSLVNMYVGSMAMLAIIVGGLFYTASLQKKGLHAKTRYQGIFIHPSKIRLIHAG
jgi:hypothetical protein